MQWSEFDIEVNGTLLHAYRRGAGRGSVPLVLAHGFTDNGLCWQRVADRLHDDFDLIAFDARCHGRSATAWSSAELAGDDLIALVEALHLERPLAMGHSMGAQTVSIAVAARPDLFRAAVLEDPPWGLVLPPRPSFESLESLTAEQLEQLEQLAAALAAAQERQAAQTAESITREGKAANPSWHDDEFPAWAQSKLQFRTPPEMTENNGRIPFPPWQPIASRLSIPVLLAVGRPERGGIVTPEVAAQARQLCPTLEVASFDAGHNIRREAFEEFVTAVSHFFAAHRGTL